MYSAENFTDAVLYCLTMAILFSIILSISTNIYSKKFIQIKLSKENIIKYKKNKNEYWFQYFLFILFFSCIQSFWILAYDYFGQNWIIHVVILSVPIFFTVERFYEKMKYNKSILNTFLDNQAQEYESNKSNTFKPIQDDHIKKIDKDIIECPKCAETIKAKAVICRFCKYNFETENFE